MEESGKVRITEEYSKRMREENLRGQARQVGLVESMKRRQKIIGQ